MLVWLLVLVTFLLVTPVLFALAHLAKRLRQQKRQGFARRAAPDTTAVDIPAPLTRKKPDWVVQEVLRLKALMGKQVGCRKVADTFNRLHAPIRVGKSFVQQKHGQDAVTWRALDKLPGYDAGAAETFKRGAYQQNIQPQNASLTPSHGVERAAIAPPHGVERVPPTPSHGAIRGVLPNPPTPSHGNHLDMPSIAVNPVQGNYHRLTAKPIGMFTNLLH